MISTNPAPQMPRQRRRRGRAVHRRAGQRPVVLPMAAGLAAVLLLTAMAMLTGRETTASVALTAVVAIVTAALAPRR